MLGNIRTIQAIKIIDQTQTKGSAPLLVLGNDDQSYFAKTTSQSNPACEVINELLCAYFAKCWQLQIPEFCLIQIHKDVVDDYTTSSGKLSAFYKDGFEKNLLFGSERIAPAIELDIYFEIVNKRDLRLFENPLDFLKIGIFDLWIGNKDRKPENPNILIGNANKLFNFHPIDHAAAFAYLTNYREVREILLRLDPKNCILSMNLAKTIRNFVNDKDIITLKEDVNDYIITTIKNLDFIFDQIPAPWGLSKKAKLHLHDFLSDNKRNQTIINTFLSYLI